MTPAAASSARPTPAPPAAARVPPLQSGDRLTADEFERRYDATPDLRKAELINGVVYMPPPVSDDMHAAPHFDMGAWLGMYRLFTPGVVGGLEGTLRLDRRSRPQPDGYLRVLPECGGQAARDAGGYITTGPELVAEVAASSAGHDLHDKLDLYQAYGVREYIVWRTYDGAIDWFASAGQAFVPIPTDPDGVIRSRALPGLWLDAAALVAGDAAGLVRAAQAGLASPEHAAFVQRLQSVKDRRAEP
ncbi:MAG: hypothetical protein JWO31_2005 [Phycisphaerales bacterium]|nr:hypothetical protein [Phycisphaerales bacterium]